MNVQSCGAESHANDSNIDSPPNLSRGLEVDVHLRAYFRSLFFASGSELGWCDAIHVSAPSCPAYSQQNLPAARLEEGLRKRKRRR